MKHYIYKTTNLITGTYYIGCHSCEELDNDYLGSGTYLRNSVRKYGAKNFKKEIWFLCKDTKAKFYLESIIVTEELIKDSACMNLKPGGRGSFTAEQRRKGAIGMNKALWSNNEWRKYKSEQLSIRNLKAVERGTHPFLENNKNGKVWLGRKHKPESIEKLKKTYKKIKHQQGERNSQFGTMWITNGKECCKIKKDQSIPEDWRKGRS